jgi:mannose-6-phosphate isomerase-like protein (cupin superfamily)
VSHPDPDAAPDLRPIEVGEVWENPVTKELARVIELPWGNPDGRLVAELRALPGARVLGEHMHPQLRERFSAIEGELTVLRNRERSTIGPGETAEIPPGVWHDWWNEGDVDAIVRVEVAPGERFMHAIEALFGLAREGHVDAKGRPGLLQGALIGREFADTIVFRRPPPAAQRVLFGVLAPLARMRGYRATYPSLSRTTLAPRTP